MKDFQTYEGTSNGDGYGYGLSGSGYGYGSSNGYGNRNGSGYGHGNGNLNLLRLFPIPEEYYYLLKGQTIPQRVKVMYDLHNASNQEEIEVLVEWYETVQDLEKAT